MFLVQEYQKANGHLAVLNYEYENMADAQEKFYDIMKYAVKSDTERHGAAIVDDYFEVIKKEIYEHK